MYLKTFDPPLKSHRLRLLIKLSGNRLYSATSSLWRGCATPPDSTCFSSSLLQPEPKPKSFMVIIIQWLPSFLNPLGFLFSRLQSILYRAARGQFQKGSDDHIISLVQPVSNSGSIPYTIRCLSVSLACLYLPLRTYCTPVPLAPFSSPHTRQTHSHLRSICAFLLNITWLCTSSSC